MSERVFYERGANQNDPLTVHAEGAGVWGDPSAPDDRPAELPLEHFDYSTGIFVGVPGQEADAIPGTLHPTVVAKLTTTQPVRTYETLHEATHRRYDSPRTVSIAQTAAGFTLVAPPRPGLHFIKILAVMLTLDAAGTIKFVQGSTDGTVTADLSGAMPTAQNGGFVLPPADLSTPWLWTAPDQALGIFTVTGKAFGFVTFCESPFDA